MTSVDPDLPIGVGGGIRGPDVDRPTSFDGDDGRRALVLFLEQLRETLRLVDDRAELLFDARFARLLHPAWERLEPRFAEVREAIAVADEDTLQRHGLLGPELELKLDVWATSRETFVSSLAATAAPGRRSLTGWMRGLSLRPVKRALGRALGHADTVIESVASVLPGPASAAAGGIGELKTVVEKVADRGR